MENGAFHDLKIANGVKGLGEIRGAMKDSLKIPMPKDTRRKNGRHVVTAL